MVEQGHRFIKKRIAASLGFRSVQGALNTVDGYEAMHMIRKGQVRWLRRAMCSASAPSFTPCSASPPKELHRFARARSVSPTAICDRSPG